MSKARDFFRLLAVGLLLAALPADCCCAAGFADSHTDSHHETGAGSHHDGAIASNQQLSSDHAATRWEAGECQHSSFLTSGAANRVAAGIPSTGPDRVATAAWSTGIPNSTAAVTAAVRLRQPTRSPPLTLVSLQVLHLA